MKKFLSVIVHAALYLTLAACSGQAAASFDPAADAETLLSSGAFSEALTEIDAPTACALYGIDEDTVTSCAVYGSTGTTAEELAIFACTDEDAAADAAQQLTYRVEDRIEELTNYLPDELPKLESAVVETRGSSVLLAVAADYTAIDAFLGD